MWWITIRFLVDIKLARVSWQSVKRLPRPPHKSGNISHLGGRRQFGRKSKHERSMDRNIWQTKIYDDRSGEEGDAETERTKDETLADFLGEVGKSNMQQAAKLLQRQRTNFTILMLYLGLLSRNESINELTFGYFISLCAYILMKYSIIGKCIATTTRKGKQWMWSWQRGM